MRSTVPSEDWALWKVLQELQLLRWLQGRREFEKRNEGIATAAGERRGFTLVELVVVVLILGILAAVAAPKMFDTATAARENGTRQSLSVLRDAVELYRAQNGSYPPASSLMSNLQPFLKGPFPAPQVGANQNSSVAASTQDPITSPESGTDGWAYNETTGQLVINDAAFISW